MTRRARLWITGATASDHSRAPAPACRPSRPAPGRRHEWQWPSRHGGDGIAFLDVLAAQLRARLERLHHHPGWAAGVAVRARPARSSEMRRRHRDTRWRHWALVVLVQLGRADRSRPRACRSGGCDHQGSPAARGRARNTRPAARSQPPGPASGPPSAQPAEPITPGCNPAGTSLAVTRQRYRPRRDSRSARSDRLP